MKKALIVLLVIIAILASGGLSLMIFPSQSGLEVFHAGSLSLPFKKIDEKNDNLNLERTSVGSVGVMRKITELGKRPDIAAVSDYSLIKDFLMPENLTDWYVQFARNEVVIAYNENSSKYSGEINENNWYKILNRQDVRFGFGNPNADPGGYRAMMILMLAEKYYGKSRIFDNLIASNTSMDAPSEENRAYRLEAVKMPELDANTEKLEVSAKEVGLVSSLETGSIDYMINYRSVAIQHGFDYVNLPNQIDLSKVKYSEFYGKARVQLSGGNVKRGKPIVYGITTLKNAKNRKSSIQFLKYLFSESGREVFRDMGQEPIKPPITNNAEKVPEELQNIVKEE